MTPELEAPVFDAAQWANHARRSLQLCGPYDDPAWAAVKQALSSDKPLRAVEWARLAHSLAPRDETRIFIGLGWICESRLGLAHACFSSVLDGCPNELNRSIALTNLATTLVQLGDVAAAWTHYRQALEGSVPLIGAYSGLMYTSLLIGDRQTFLHTAQAFASFAPAGHPAVFECRSRLAGIASSIGRPLPSGQRTLESLWDTLPEVTRELLLPLRERDESAGEQREVVWAAPRLAG